MSTDDSVTHTAPLAHTGVGTFRGDCGERADSWRGIRYAEPPTGSRRFRRAEATPARDGVVDARRFGPVCPQELNPAIPLGPDMVMAEDCLFLNVWAPSGAAAAAARLPVMVWLHGGAYVLGSGSQPLYDGAALAASGQVVVVTLNYRLGIFGFSDLSSIDSRFETNVALSDVLTALRWVGDHIAAFGGSPESVTLFGESAGAGLVTALLTMPSAAGLFHRAIAQSSPVTSMYDGERAARVTDRLLELAGIGRADAVRALTDLSADALTHLTTRLFEEVPTTTPGTIAFAPVVDGDLLPEHPLDAYRAGRAHRVPLVIGTNKDEANLFKWMKSPLMPITPDDIERMFAVMQAEYPDVVLPERAQVLSAYAGIRPKVAGLGVARDVAFRMPTLWLAQAQSAYAPVFLYRFDWSTRALRMLKLGAAHATELPYVWGNLGTGSKDVTFLLGGRKTGEGLSERLMSRWAAFAHAGDPNPVGLDPQWPMFAAGSESVLVFDETDRAVDDLDADLRRAWGDDVLSFR